jgi:hypothetical protein
MKTQMKLLFKSIFEYLDIILAGVCAFFGIAIFYLSLIGRISQPIIGITLILTSCIYLLIRSRLKEYTFQNFQFSSRKKEILSIIFCVLVIITSVLWYNQLYSRPLIYFLIVSLLSGLISVEILFLTKEDNVWPILFKIFIVALLIRMGIYYNFPSFLGYDAIFHINIADLISTTGSVPPFEISSKYVNYPILHIFIAITKIISFTTIKDAVFFSIGIISVISALFIFIFVNRFAGPRVGLLATLLYSITTQIIVMGITNITAGSLVLCYFLMLVCLLIDRERHPNTLLLCLIIMFTMVVAHQLSSFVVFLSLCLFAMSLFIYEHVFMIKNKKISFKLFLALFGITMVFYWIYTPMYQNISFFEAVLTPIIDFFNTGGSYGSDLLIVGHNYERPLFETIILQTSYLILPFFGIAGIFFWLSRKDEIKFSIAFTAGVLFFIVYAVPLLGTRNLLTDRWMPFLSVFLGIVAAAYIISGIELIKSNTAKIGTILIILTLLSVFLIGPPEINKDNPLVGKDKTIRNQFTYSEIESAGTITQLNGENIITDSSFQSLFDFHLKNNTLRQFQSENQLIEDSKRHGSLIILRKTTLSEPISLQSSELSVDFYAGRLSKTTFEYFETEKNRNLVFTDGNIIGYQSNRVE